MQSPWHPLQCLSYDCRPGTCSGIVEVVVGMRLVSQNSMKRSKVSTNNGIVYRHFMYWRKYQTMKIAKSLMMDLSRQYSSKAKVRMMHRFYSGCLLYLVNLHAFTLLRRFSVTIVLRGYLLIFRNCWFQIKVYLFAYNPKFASHCKSKRSSWSSNYSCYWQCTP